MAVSAKGEILIGATCQYIQDGHHIILKGASGNGNVIFIVAMKCAVAGQK
mgnify:CR=1 FL=1|jgi:hypothetical protein